MNLKPRLRINPIIVKELRSRMRGARAFVILTGVLLLLSTFSYALYRMVVATTRYSTSPLSPQIGQALFVGLAFLELLMVCFITPAVTAGAISGEQEKLTYEMLLATPLRPASILWGKLVAALSYVFLLIFAAVPMASLVFIFGGVSPLDMLKALVILLAVTVTLGVVGIFMSVWLGRTPRATVLSYLVVLAQLVGPVFVYIFAGVLRQTEPPRWILIPNPMSALFSALTPAMPGNGPASFFWGLGMALGGNLGVMTRPGAQAGTLRPLYHYTLPLYGALTLVLYLLATRLVRPTRRWRISWKEALVALTSFLIFAGAVTLAFVSTADRYEKVSIFSAPRPTPPAHVRVMRVPPPPPPPALPTPAPATLSTVPEDDQVAIYAAAVRQLVTVDHAFSDQAPDAPLVYLVRTTDDSVGDPDAPHSEPRVLPEKVQEAVVDALAGLAVEFRWVDDADEVPRDGRSSVVEGGGAIITLGNIHFQEDGSALVSASLYFANLGALGKTYIVERVDGLWQVVGTTGVEWIS
ncbi:MAG TPA: hypothetical protein EYP56_15650 [Planctomycetaceae bacterium]|nr:hypothetical protein [Planctomycetaceae bacterium]